MNVTEVNIWQRQAVVVHVLHERFFVFCTFRSRAGCSCPINTEKWPVLLLCGRRKVFSTNIHFFQICEWGVGFRENLDFYRLSNIPPPIMLWSGLLGQVIRITDSCEAKQFMDSLLHELYSNQCVPELVVRTHFWNLSRVERLCLLWTSFIMAIKFNILLFDANKPYLPHCQGQNSKQYLNQSEASRSN